MACPLNILAGVDFILKEDGSPGGALLTTSKSISINGESVDVTDGSSNGWRVLAPGAGIRSASISVSGVFRGTPQEESLQMHALDNSCATYDLYDSDGNHHNGPFLVTSYEKTGDANGAILWSATLESAGEITVTNVGSP